jgi:uncharacterized protein
MLEAIIVIIGLCMFETISSIDNAVINASVLKTIKNKRAMRFFVTWGMFIAIFAMRGILPIIIYYIPNASLGFMYVMRTFWSGDAAVTAAMEHSAPMLLLAGGSFLVLLCLHWLFMEPKDKFGLSVESYFLDKGSVWFYSIASLLLMAEMIAVKNYVAPEQATNLMLSAAVGNCVFFITSGFKEHAERVEKELIDGGGNGDTARSDWAKVMFLEVIDATFSIDGVVGAFAFTMSVPLILIGNGLGAIVVRQLTLGNIERITRYAYLKNGAMYSIGVLGMAMVIESFGIHLPSWFSPLVTLIMILYFLGKSVKENRLEEARANTGV